MPQQFAISVISMPESTQRRAAAIKQLDALGLEYTVHLFARNTTLNVDEYSQKERLGYYGYDMQPGEIGCFLSHRALWKLVSDSNKPTLVLEDDFLLTHDHIPKMLSWVAQRMPRLGIVKLQKLFSNTNAHCLENLPDGLRLVLYSHKKPGGGVAYFINNTTAKTLYNASMRFFYASRRLHRCCIFTQKYRMRYRTTTSKHY